MCLKKPTKGRTQVGALKPSRKKFFLAVIPAGQPLHCLDTLSGGKRRKRVRFELAFLHFRDISFTSRTEYQKKKKKGWL